LYSGAAQEAEAVGQALQHAFGKDEPALFSLRLQDLENQLLFAQAGRAGDGEVLGHLIELLDTHILQLHQVERGRAVLLLGVLALLSRWPCGAPPSGRSLPGSASRGASPVLDSGFASCGLASCSFLVCP